MARRAFAAIVGAFGIVVAAFLVFQSGLWIDVVGVGEYGEATVTITDGEDGQQLGTVDVRIANTTSQRYTGLSDTESLGADEGMLFVHATEEEHTYVMRRMSFPLDIIFIAANGTITTIHHAPTPPDGEEYSREYPGVGKYVLEVNRGWTNETGVRVGDTVELPESVR